MEEGVQAKPWKRGSSFHILASPGITGPEKTSRECGVQLSWPGTLGPVEANCEIGSPVSQAWFPRDYLALQWSALEDGSAATQE